MKEFEFLSIKIETEKEFKEYVKSKETKKGKLTIIVSKNYKELYEDNLALVNHILLNTVKNDEDWIESVQKSNLNITLYTDKNDTELFKKSFDKFEVKLIDKGELLNGWYKNGNFLMYHNFDTDEKYGFCHNNFWIKGDLKASEGHIDNCVLATHEEVEERLKEEAIKRGFKEGVKIDRSNFDTRLGIETIADNYLDDVGVKLYEDEEHGVFIEYDGYVIMNNGIWAEIVEEKLTLENIQVDCSELTTEQIEEMKRVVVDNGFKLWGDAVAFRVDDYDNHFYYGGNDFAILTNKNNLKTITYDKFMELFDTKIVMDNGSTISNVKEGEAKSIEELHAEHTEQNSIGKSYNKKHLHLEEPVFNPQSHYNNENGSLYQIAEQLGLNAYEFDILKRVVRCRKKGQFEEDLQKTKDLIDLYLLESKK